jgi:hypothetical protein
MTIESTQAKEARDMRTLTFAYQQFAKKNQIGPHWFMKHTEPGYSLEVVCTESGKFLTGFGLSAKTVTEYAKARGFPVAFKSGEAFTVELPDRPHQVDTVNVEATPRKQRRRA